jgi:hypothetical protein
MRHAFFAAAGLGALLAGAPARADNAACAQIQEPLAYNACLARFGPRAPEVRAIAPPGGEDFTGTEDAEPKPGRRDPAASRAHGRMRVEFDVGRKRRQP